MPDFLNTNSRDSDQNSRCGGKTKRGQPCKNSPVKGKKYCSTHLKQRRIKVTAIFSISILLLGILADWIEVSSYFGIDYIKKTSSSHFVTETKDFQQEVFLDNAPQLIKQIYRIKSTIELFKFLNTLVRKGDIAVGEYSDFEDDGKDILYVIIVDDEIVLDFFRYRNFVFYDVDSNYNCRELRTKYKNKRKIWLLHFSD